jgi:hypothetical protein
MTTKGTTMTEGFSVPDMRSEDAEIAMEEIIDVTDACRAYFEHGKVPYTAADMVALAKMVLARVRETRDAAKRARWEKAHQIEEVGTGAG